MGIFSSIANKFKEGVAGVKDVLQGKPAVPSLPPATVTKPGVFAQVAEKKLQPNKASSINVPLKVQNTDVDLTPNHLKPTPIIAPPAEKGQGIFNRVSTLLDVQNAAPTPATMRLAPQPLRATMTPEAERKIAQDSNTPQEPEPLAKELVFPETEFDPMSGPKPSSPRLATERISGVPLPKAQPSLKFPLSKEGETYIKSKSPEWAKNANDYERIAKFKESEDFKDTVSEFGASIAQILPKALAAPILDVAQKGEWTPDSLLGQVVFGDKPVESLQRKVDNSVQQWSGYLKSKGIDSKWSDGLAVGFAPLFVAGMQALDLSPIGGAEKNAGRVALKVAAINDVEKILPELRTLFGASDDMLRPIAKTLSGISDPKEAETVLNTFIKNKDIFEESAKGLSPLEKVRNVLSEGQQQIKDAQPNAVTEWVKSIGRNFYDKFQATKPWEVDIEKELGRKLTPEESIYVGMRVQSGSGGIVQNKLNELSTILKDNPKAVEAGYLDEFLFANRAEERAARDIANPGNISQSESTQALQELRAEIGDEAFVKVQKAADQIYKYSDDLLKYMVDNEFISPEAMAKIKSQNKQYTPFDVVSYLVKNFEDAGGLDGAKKSFSISDQSLVKTLKGTTEAVDLPLNALVRHTIQTIDTVERNNVAKQTAKIGKELGENSKLVVNLVDPEKVVIRQQAFREIQNLKAEFDSIKESLKITNKVDSKIITKLSTLQEEIDTLSQKAVDTFLASSNAEGKEVARQIISIKEDVSKAIKQAAKEAENIREQDIILKTKTKERVRVLNQDIAEAEKAVARATDNTTVEKAQEKLITALHEKEKILDEGKTIHLGAPKPETEIIIKSEMEVPGAKKAIEKNIIKKNNKEIETLKERIALRENNISTLEDVKAGVENKLDQLYETLAEKKTQMKNVWEDIKVNADKDLPDGYERINYIENGIKSSIAVPKEVGEAFKHLNSTNIDMISRGMAWWNKGLRGGATAFNAAFIIPNVIRDLGTAILSTKHGFNPLDFARGSFEAFKGMLKEKGFNVSSEIFDAYQKAGADMGGYFTTYLNDVPKTVKDLSRSKWHELARLVYNPFHLISTFGQVTERATRLGEFTKALSKGMGAKGAALAARDITVDFSKMGDAMKLINMWVPFVNPRVQGTINIAKALARSAKDPEEAVIMAAKIGGLAIAPFVATYLWNQEKFPEVWDDLADYEKANNIIVVLGDHKDEAGRYDQIIKIPKGSFNYFIDPVQDVMEYMKGNNPDVIKSLIGNSLANVSPLGIVRREGIAKTLLASGQNLLPPIAKSFVEAGTNQNTYTGQEIVRGDTLQAASSENQYYEYTPYLAKKLGDLLNISPLQVENFVKTNFAGVGRQVMGLGGTVSDPGPTNSVGNDIKGRFSSASGGGEQAREFKEIDKLKMEDADKTILVQRSAEANLRALANASSQEEIAKIVQDIEANPDVREKMTKIIEKEAKDLEPVISSVQRLSPESRAKYIKNKIDSTKDKAELAAFIRQIKAAKLFTKETEKEFAKLVTQKESQ